MVLLTFFFLCIQNFADCTTSRCAYAESQSSTNATVFKQIFHRNNDLLVSLAYMSLSR